MPSRSDGIAVPADAAAVADRYRRIERPISGGVALVVASIAGVAVFLLPLLWGVAGALATVAVVRLPLIRSGGTTTLSTDADLADVRADFASACPPPLAFQWGIADDIQQTDDGWAYTITYLFGLRSTRQTIERRSTTDDATDLELIVTGGGRPWATYAVATDADDDGRTTVEFTVDSNRRFGLRRVPQWFVARHYREAALAAQGYSVVERTGGLSL